jgi:hypothetical protein
MDKLALAYPMSKIRTFNIDRSAANFRVFREQFQGWTVAPATRESHEMRRYFFDLHNGDGPIRDDTGIQLPSRQSVAMEVSRILLEVASDELPYQARTIVSITVRDDTGRAISVASLTFNNEWLE